VIRKSDQKNTFYAMAYSTFLWYMYYGLDQVIKKASNNNATG